MAKKVDTRKLREAIARVIPEIKAAENMKKLGEQAAGMVKLRTRLGSGVAKDGGDKQKLAKLADSTKAVRAGKIAFFRQGGKTIPYVPENPPKLHEHTSPGKSNLTRTGQLLDSVKVTSFGYGEVTVGPEGPRNDPDSKRKLTNQQVAKYVTDGGRPFNHLSKVEVKRLSDSVKKQLREAIKRILTKR
jgi:hypothetical protein